MDSTLDEKTNAHILKLRHFIKKELQPLEEEVEAKGILDSSLAAEILEKSRALGFYGMNIPVDMVGVASNLSRWFTWSKRWGRQQILWFAALLGMFMKSF